MKHSFFGWLFYTTFVPGLEQVDYDQAKSSSSSVYSFRLIRKLRRSWKKEGYTESFRKLNGSRCRDLNQNLLSHAFLVVGI